LCRRQCRAIRKKYYLGGERGRWDILFYGSTTPIVIFYIEWSISMINKHDLKTLEKQ